MNKKKIVIFSFSSYLRFQQTYSFKAALEIIFQEYDFALDLQPQLNHNHATYLPTTTADAS